MKNPANNVEKAYASNPPQLDEHLHPVGSGMQMGTFKGVVPWQFAIKQKLKVNNLIASTVYAKNLSVSGAGTIPISNGTFTSSLYNMGTIANSLLTGGTVNTSIWQGGTINGITSEGGTLNNGVYGSPQINGGTLINGVLGTPSLTGGTVNPAVYQAGGTVGVAGTFVYIKTIDFIGQTDTLGTIKILNGIVTSIT